MTVNAARAKLSVKGESKSMSGMQASFEIDDQKSIENNLGAFAAKLTAMDADLAAVLIPKLAEWSHNPPSSHTALWTDLLNAARAEAAE